MRSSLVSFHETDSNRFVRWRMKDNVLQSVVSIQPQTHAISTMETR